MGEGEMGLSEPVTLRGRVLGLNQVEKPSQEGYVLVAFVERTIVLENRLGASPPLPNGLLVEDGPFEVVVEPGDFRWSSPRLRPAVMKPDMSPVRCLSGRFGMLCFL